MLRTWQRLKDWLLPARKKRKSRRPSSQQTPALRVRLLEERRLFHAGALVAPAAAGATNQSLPPPTTVVSLDANQNLVVQDASGAGQNDQLSFRVDAEHQRLVISDPNHAIRTTIDGAAGDGTHEVYVPLAAIAGDKVIALTGAGNDSVTLDLSAGLGGKSLLLDAGAGDQDQLALVGGTYEAVGYLLGSQMTQVDLRNGTSLTSVQLVGVEPIADRLQAGSRQFTALAGGLGMTLSDGLLAGDNISLLTTTLGQFVEFQSPAHNLTLDVAAGISGANITVSGLDSQFAGNLTVDGGAAGTAHVSGLIDLHGGDLSIRARALEVSGTIATSHANVHLEAQTTFDVTATGSIHNSGGVVTLDAGDSGTLRVFGQIDVAEQAAGQRGGDVTLLGRQIELRDQATIDASGHAGGGTVLVGGDLQGANPLVRNATNTLVGANASIRANALAAGDGGRIVIWANEQAIVAGSGNLQARGGAQGGNGGLIETSGKQYLYVAAPPDAGAPAGEGGTWLLDPLNVTINSSTTSLLSGGEFIASTPPTVATIGAAEIATALRTMNVAIYTGVDGAQAGNITLSAIINVVNPTGTFTLSLNAANDIIVTSTGGVTVSGGSLHVHLNANSGSIPGRNDDLNALSGSVLIDGAIETNGGNFSAQGRAFDNLDAAVDVAGGQISVSVNGGTLLLAVAGAGGFSTSQFTLIRNTTSTASTVNITVEGGPMTIDDSSGFSNLDNDDLVLETVGADCDITLDGNVSFTVDTISLVANGDILRANGGSVLTTTSGGEIILEADAIGTAASPFLVQPGSTLEVTASGDIFLRRNSGGLATSAFTKLVSSGSGHMVSIGTNDGSVTIDHTNAALFSTLTNDTLEVIADGSGSDITFASSLSTVLTSGDLVLIAADTIVSDTNSALDISTSAADGDITLLAAGSIGSDTNPLRMSAGGGLVSAATFTTSGDIYLESLQTMRIGTISTVTDPLLAQTVSLVTSSGDLILTAPIISDDFYVLDADADLIFPDLPHASIMADAGITARQFVTVRAGDDIISGATEPLPPPATTPPHVDLRQLDSSTLKISAASIGSASNPLVVDLPLDADLDLQASAGDLCLLVYDGDLTADRFVNSDISVQNNGQTILLGTLNGSIDLSNIPFISNYQDDALQLEAHTRDPLANPGDISLGFSPLVFNAVTLIADGRIIPGGFGLAIDTSANDGNITLKSGGSIGEFTPLQIEAADGVVSATVTQPGGIIQLVSNGPLKLGFISATQVALTSFGDEILSGAAGVNVDTSAAPGGLIVLFASGAIGAVGSPLTLQPGAGGVIAQTVTGDATLAIAGGSFQLQNFAVALGGANFRLDVQAGSLIVNSSLGGALASKNLELSASDDIVFEGQTLVAQAAKLTAGDAIVGSGSGFADIVALSGPLELIADTGIGSAMASLAVDLGFSASVTAETTAASPAGSIFLASPGTLRVGPIETAAGEHAVDLRAIGDIILLASCDTDDAWSLNSSGGSLVFGGAITLQAASVAVDVAGLITSGTAGVDIDTSSADGPINLKAGAIGFSTDEVALKPGVGTLSLETLFGEIWVAIAGGDLESSQIALLSGAGAGSVNVSLNVRDGSLIFDDLGGLDGIRNDLLRFVTGSGGDILFEQAEGQMLRGARIDLIAAGAILSDNSHNGIDLDTSQVGGPAVNGNINLVAADEVGALGAPIVVAAGQGRVFIAAGDGDIYVASPGPLFVGNAVASAAGRVISFATTGAASPLDVTTPSLADDNWHFVATGNVQLHVTGAGGIDFRRLAELDAAGQADVLLDAPSGPIDVNQIRPGVLMADDNVTLRSLGNITLGPLGPGTVLLEGANLTLEALGGSILSRDPAQHLSVGTGGLLRLTASNTIGDPLNTILFEAPSVATQSFGPQWLSTVDATRVITAVAGLAIPGFLIPTASITFHSGHFFLEPPVLPPGVPGVFATQVFIDSGVLLGGNGSIGRTVIVRSGGVIDMGFADNASGQLIVFGDLFFDPGSKLIADINAPYTTPGDDYDQIVVNGQLQLDGGALQLRGAEQLRFTINEIVLIDVRTPMILPGGPGFAIDNTTLFQDGPFVRARVGQFRGKLLFNGGDGNDVVLSELSLAPPVQNPAFRLPPLRIPVFSATERVAPPIAPPPPATPPTTEPVVEPEQQATAQRYVEVRIVIPLDDMGATREEAVLKLPAEWLERLPMILRRLPDDRYRIYLMLDGGGEERLVIDVLVRLGRPVEPSDLLLEASGDVQIVRPAGPGQPPAGGDGDGHSPEAENAHPLEGRGSATPMLIDPSAAHFPLAPHSLSSRWLAGSSAAVAAVVAARLSRPPEGKMAAAAAELAARPGARAGRWWKRPAASSSQSTGGEA